MPHANPEVKRRYHREYKRRNRHIYRRADKLWSAADHANRRAAKYGAVGVITSEDAAAILDGAVCHYCGSTENIGLDHVVPLSAGGLNARSNLVAACRSCNISKWRGDRPYRWSRIYDSCQGCGTSERRHSARGFCNACYIARFGVRARTAHQREGLSAPSD